MQLDRIKTDVCFKSLRIYIIWGVLNVLLKSNSYRILISTTYIILQTVSQYMFSITFMSAILYVYA